MNYMMWYDDSAKKPPAQKLTEAIAAYERHFKQRPTIALMHSAELITTEAIATRTEPYIRKYNYWIGVEEAAA